MSKYKNPHVALLKRAKSSWIYPIYIPSYNRAGIAILLEMLKDSYRAVQKKVHIVVRDSQVAEYEAEYPWATVVSQPEPYGIGPARAVCVQDAEARGYQRIVMMDDDIRLFTLLERTEREGKPDYTRRHSTYVNGIPKPLLAMQSLAVGCTLSDTIFANLPQVAYGAARNGLFSMDVDTRVGATLNKGSFPACVMFIDVERFTWRECHPDYYNHGEDLSMCLDTMQKGQHWFTLPGVAYDQSQTMETTIPLDPDDAVARTPDLENAEHAYPEMFPYLKASVRNKLGGIMRIGVNWPKWYSDTGTEPVEIPLTTIMEGK